MLSIILIDFLLLLVLFIIFKPLVLLALIYVLLTSTLIFDQYGSIKEFQNVRSMIVQDKTIALQVITSKLNTLDNIIDTKNSTVDTKVYRRIPTWQSVRPSGRSRSSVHTDIDRVKRINRKYSNRVRRHFNFYTRIKELILEEIYEEKRQKENEFSY